MADNNVRISRDCVNPAIVGLYEVRGGQKVLQGLRVETDYCAFKEPPPEIWMGGVRYTPA